MKKYIVRHTRRRALSTLACALSTLTGCGGGSSGESQATGTATPTPGQVVFSASTYLVEEGSATATVGVARVGGSDGLITVEVSTDDGSAQSGSDYFELSETLTFDDGDDEILSVEIALTDDDIDEPDETILLSLSNATGGATIGNTSTTEVIIGDDEPNEYEVGVSVSGLLGDGLILTSPGADDLAVSADGSYSFSKIFFEGDSYDVVVSIQPWSPAQTCAIQNGAGVVDSTGIEDVEVVCDDAQLQTLIVGRAGPSQGSGKSDLYSVREDGEQLLQLTSTPDVDERVLTVHGERLIYVREELSALRYSLRSIQRDGTLDIAVSRFPSPRLGGITDEGIAVYSSDGNLYSVDVSTGSHSDLLVSPEEDRVERVTGDGRVVFSRTIGNQANLYAIDINGSNLTPLATAADHESFSNITSTGRLIYSSQQANGDGRRDLYSGRPRPRQDTHGCTARRSDD